MLLLVSGIIILMGVHLVPSIPALRRRLIESLGERGYMAAFAGMAFAGMLMIIIGKVTAPFVPLWQPPGWGRSAALAIMPFAFILLAGAYLPSNIKRFTAHPMLWGVVVWATAHLLGNGDLSSLVLFGGLGTFSLVMMASAQARGAMISDTRQAASRDIATVATGIVMYGLFLAAHPYLFGTPVFP